MIDYKELLTKYMAHVIDDGGSDLLYAQRTFHGDTFTDEELDELERISDAVMAAEEAKRSNGDANE